MNKKLLIALFVAGSANAFAQDTYTKVYTLFQTKCIGCHGATSPSGLLNLTESNPADVYDALVDANPVNPMALSKGNKRVAPGDPFRSFLYRKLIQHAAVDGFTKLEANGSEGVHMPEAPNAPLSNYEVELVRQWIMWGAPETGNVVDTAVINRFYTEGGINMNPIIPDPPAAGEGFQFHVGRFFVEPGGDHEHYFKIDPKLPEDLEVTRFFLRAPLQNHHFIIYKFFNGMDATFPAGLRDSDFPSHGTAESLSGFKNLDNDLIFPPGTAVQVPGSSVFDYNFHIVNTNPDSVLAGDIYYNIYTQPVGTADNYIYTATYPVFDIAIPWDNQEHEYVSIANDTNNIETRYWMVWHMYTHTHRYGIDYDVFVRNEDGTEGYQAYEGFYNADYTFNQGYYAYRIDAVAQRFFEEPYLKVDPRLGFIHKAKYINTAGPDTVFFGPSALDEMMAMGFQYFYGDPLPASIDEKYGQKFFTISPNPGSGEFNLKFDDNNPGNQQVLIQVMNTLGQTVKELSLANTPSGNVALDLHHLGKGIYVVRVFSGKEFYSQKLVIE